MGWAGGTELFDSCVTIILAALEEAKEEPVSIEQTQLIVNEVYAAFSDSDWDTESESDYFMPFLLHTLHEVGQIDDDDYEYYLGGM